MKKNTNTNRRGKKGPFLNLKKVLHKKRPQWQKYQTNKKSEIRAGMGSWKISVRVLLYTSQPPISIPVQHPMHIHSKPK